MNQHEKLIDPVKLFGEWLDKVEQGKADDPEEFKSQFNAHFPEEMRSKGLYNIFLGFLGGIRMYDEMLKNIMKDSEV